MVISPFTTYPFPQTSPMAAYPHRAFQAAPSHPAFNAKTPTMGQQPLIDPITRKQLKLPSPFSDKILHPGVVGKIQLNAEQTFMELPRMVRQGLAGDKRVTFSDSLKIANIPYYMGGLVLAGSFLAGGAKIDFARQSVGVGLYYLGMNAANSAINAFYQWRTGIDLNMRFRRSNGDIEKVFASADFPRFDLLTDADYKRLAQKMDIPDNIADPKREVNEQARQIISASRTEKIVFANLLAVIGAGYIARSDAWSNLLHGNGELKATWNLHDPSAGGLLQRLGDTMKILGAKVGPALYEKLMGSEAEKSPWPRRSVFGGMALLTGLIFLHAWRTLNRSRRKYESPLNASLAPELVPESSPRTAAIQKQLPGGAIRRPGRVTPPGMPRVYGKTGVDVNQRIGGFRL